MDERERTTVRAAYRLIKSRMRRRLYEEMASRPSADPHLWEPMLELEHGISAEAEADWQRTLAVWHKEDVREREHLTGLLGPALHDAMMSVMSSLGSTIPMHDAQAVLGGMIGAFSIDDVLPRTGA